MESLLAVLPALGCVVMMPAMMWLMSRGMKGNDATAPTDEAGHAEEVRQLRQEVARLRAEVDTESRPQESTGA